MQKIIIILLFSLCISSSSYQGLLIPSTTFELITQHPQYLMLKNNMMSSKKYHYLSTNYISFPNLVSSNSIIYHYNVYNTLFRSGIQIINYGDIEDSETGYKFSSYDYIITQKIYQNNFNSLLSSLELKYLFSQIDNFNSNIFTFNINMSYHFSPITFELFLNNYGKIIKTYTSYNEKIPKNYGYSLMLKPKHLNLLFLFKHEFYEETYKYNFSGELMLKNSSILLGFSSIANNLYFGEFYNDFFTGISFGFNTQYKKINLNLGYQNLGPLGTVTSITLNKLLN